MVSIEDIRESADSWMTVQKPGVRDASGIYARRRFISYTTSWLSYMGQLICEDDAFPFKEHVMEYLDWLKQNKGYSSSTTEGRYSQLKTMMLNLKVDGLKDITSSVLDDYIRKRHDEDGCNISGGEAQKIAIARALYKDAPFVILDEPTAALDPESEYEIFSTFDRLVQGKGSVFISHRMGSCRFCQEIFVLDQGKMVQCGSHEDLIQEDGPYQELFSAQADCYVE